jgi:ankyrin repeat protein
MSSTQNLVDAPSPPPEDFENLTEEQVQRLLYDYIIDGKFEEFKALLDAQIAKNPLEPLDTLCLDNESLATLTHKAARYNQVEILEYLVNKGATLETNDFLDSTPLMYASASGSTKAASFLLSRGANANAKDKYQMSPLILAMKNSHFETASVLLLGGADIHVKGPRGNSALHLACEEGNLDKVKFLMENGAVITRTNQKSQNCLFSALKHQHVLEYLIGCLNNGNGGAKSAYRLLLARDDQTRTVIHHCIENDYKSSLAYLIQFLSTSKTTLKEFVNDKEQLFGNTPLHLAISAGKIDITRLLVETKEVEIDAQNNAGNTALHLAVQNNNEGLAQYLVHVGGANKKVKNNNKITVSQVAKDKKMELKKFSKAQELGVDPSLGGNARKSSIWSVFKK